MVAIARTITEIAYLLISDPGLRFHDLGADYYTTLNPARQTRNKIRDLERLNPGMKVTLTPIEPASAAAWKQMELEPVSMLGAAGAPNVDVVVQVS